MGKGQLMIGCPQKYVPSDGTRSLVPLTSPLAGAYLESAACPVVARILATPDMRDWLVKHGADP